MKSFLSILLYFAVSVHCFAQGQLFYAATENAELLKLNIATCDSSFIGSTGTILSDIAITPDLRLYGTDGLNLYEIDTATAALTLISNLPNIPGENSLVSDSAGNLLTVANDSVYRIDRFTGQSFCMGYFGPYHSAGDLAFYNDTLYLTASPNKLVKIILYPTVSSQLVGTMTGGSNIFGINTICLNDTETLVASSGNFRYSSIYRVNPTNASLSLLCDSIIYYIVYGAASLRDINTRTGCIAITDLHSTLVNSGIKIFPNPGNALLTVLLSSEKPSEVILFDITSRQLLKQTFTHSTQLNVENLASGIYLYQIRNEDGLIGEGKWIKEK